MICDGCKTCWYWQSFDSSYRNGERACHFCFYNGHSRGQIVDGKCQNHTKTISDEKLIAWRKRTDPVKGGVRYK